VVHIKKWKSNLFLGWRVNMGV